MTETKNIDNASRSGPGQTLKSCYVGTDIMESMIAWHQEAQAKGRAETLSQEAITLYHRNQTARYPKVYSWIKP